MRKLILGLAISLDGYIEGPNGEYDWCFTDQDYGLQEFYSKIDAMYIGRKSHEMMQKFAEETVEEPIPNLPSLTEYVFSTTLESVKEGVVLIPHNSMEEAKRIKELPGKDIWLFGGASLFESLMKEKLVDELWLSVHPILLGAGKPLFRGTDDRFALTLLESKTYDTGLVSLHYKINGTDSESY